VGVRLLVMKFMVVAESQKYSRKFLLNYGFNEIFFFQENRERQTEEEMADLDNIGVSVELHIYDLTKGLAASLSQMLLGKWKPF